jgi:ureidoacrylate peracid hydrolase
MVRDKAAKRSTLWHGGCVASGMRTPSRTPRPKLAPAASEAAAFGPATHNAWQLHGDRISLVRKPRRPRPLRIDAAPQPIEIDLARSALVVVDMQNDFCHPEGWFAQKGIGIKAARRPVPVLQPLLPAWRKAGGAVVWLNWGIRADRLNLSPTIHFKGKRSADGVGYAEHSPIDHGPSLVQGSWGAQVIDELAAAPGDITVHKHRLSGFWDNEFDSVLRQQGIATLLFAGINTDRCVFSTLQDAAFLGYDCVLLEDACSTPSPAYVTRGVRFIVQQLHGFVATAAALQRALSASSTSPASLSPRSKRVQRQGVRP